MKEKNFYNNARRYHEDGQYKDAIVAINKAIELNKNNRLYWNLLEEFYYVYHGNTKNVKITKSELIELAWQAIKFIQNPSEEIQLEAIKNNWEAIQYIRKPSEEVQLKAVRKNWQAIKYIKNSSIELQLAALKLGKKSALKYMTTKFLFVYLQTVFTNTDIEILMEDISEELFEEIECEAVRRNPEAIKYIKNPSYDMLYKLIKENWKIIQHLRNPSEDIQLLAVKTSRNAIKYIKNPTENVQLEAIGTTGNAIQFIENPTEKVKLEAVKKTKSAIQYIENPSKDILAAANQNWPYYRPIETESKKSKEEVPNDFSKPFNDLKLDKSNKYKVEKSNINLLENNEKYNKELETKLLENIPIGNSALEYRKIDNEKVQQNPHFMKNGEENKKTDGNKIFKNLLGNKKPEKVERTVYWSKRNITIVKYLKQLYENKCQICNNQLEIGYNEFVSEVHHIQPLGEHKGPDIIENMIVLCPNCHVMFDRGAITIDLNARVVKHINPSNPLNNTKVTISHRIEERYLDYYTKNIYSRKLLNDNEKENPNNQITAVAFGSNVMIEDIHTNEEFLIKIEEYENREFMDKIQSELLYKKLNESFNFEGYTYRIVDVKV
ncbi:HNH endonuclease [Clostridium formicaceticum]|uniref:HNH endonuclease n=1 Tax=Clostridium formicaceticum TaxID=1497 RepID=A0AAC9RPU6_9CLOT|nr:HNH endonuclease [Clostridium formicaceticum]AOY74695.1 hypothetical protein BJL90_01235 [Clostridium formicaceticum]ARE89073.1 HNH endonuclease [Clostridium formicaceticum]